METYILMELQGILIIPKYDKFKLCKTRPLDKPWANLSQNIKIGTITRQGNS